MKYIPVFHPTGNLQLPKSDPVRFVESSVIAPALLYHLDFIS